MRTTRRVFSLATLALLLAPAAQSQAQAQAQSQSDRSVVIARLVSFPRRNEIAGCGRVHFIELVEYELVRVVSGTPPATARFWVAVSCPAESPVPLATGAVCQLTLSRRAPPYGHAPTPLATGTPPFLWVLNIAAAR